MICTLCRQGTIAVVPQFGELPRVTSDCRPWRRGGSIGLCTHCGGIQKPLDDAYRHELSAIYGEYVMYAQSGGAEQRSIDAAAGALAPRSEQIVGAFVAENAVPENGRWLDVGCGNGATLRAVSQRLPGWRMVGSELDDRNRDTVEAIEGVDRLHTGDLASLDDTFDVVSLVHVFEHVEDPPAFLASLARLLREDGVILIESPLAEGNAFDLAIADHVTHFGDETLRATIGRAGMRCRSVVHRFFDREICAVAERSEASQVAGTDSHEVARSRSMLERQVGWLAEVAAHLESLEGRVGLFGSSIGATFAYAARAGDVAFFIDEDPGRIGRKHLGVEIVAPDAVHNEGQVFVPLPPQLAKAVASKPGRESWLLPPL